MSIVVQLPDAARSFVEEQVATGRFSTPGEFIANLVEQAQRHAAHEHVERLLLEGLNSGPPIEVDRDWWLKKADEWAKKYAGDSPT
jgi:Predicted transcriptional regulators containing the CopG/Arc/MetJ DNA-binding domain